MHHTPGKAILTLLVAALAGLSLSAQVRRPQKTQAELERSYADKLEQSWFVDGGWTDDYDLARKRAAAQNKFIFAYFTRTYAP